MPRRPGAAGKSRLDVALVERELAPTREKARALIMAGRVLVAGSRVDKPGTAVPDGIEIRVRPGPRPFASRGGEKLDPVLDALAIDPSGWRCLDVGASTGGFTDVLLRRGASHVTAVDVGRGLLDATLRDDARVTAVEGVNARYLQPEQVDPPYDLATMDLSFISVALVLPAVLPLLPGGRLLALVKPQFEAGRGAVGHGGVVRDPDVRAETVRRICHTLEDHSWRTLRLRASPVAGPKGNREVFVYAAPGGANDHAALEESIREEVHRDPA